MYKREIKLFKEGVKPAILVKHMVDGYNGQGNQVRVERSEYTTNEYNELLGKYIGLKLPVRNEVMFFHTEESMVAFNEKLQAEMEQHGRVEVNYDSKLLGDALGYPPMATEAWDKYFMHDNKNKATMKKGEIDYYGMKFLCLPEDVDDCIDWLMINRPVPESISSTDEITVRHIESKPNKLEMK